MKRTTPLALLLAMCVVVAGGCSGDEGNDVGVSRGAGGNCLRAWNAEGNTKTRHEVARHNRGWSVDVSTAHVSHPADDFIGSGCSYFFYSAARWASYSGMWESDGDLRWGIPPNGRGARTPEQNVQPRNAVLRDHGRLERLTSHLGPVSDQESRDVIDDWYDDGEFDHVHRCGAVEAAIGRLPTGGREYSTVEDDLRAYMGRVC